MEKIEGARSCRVPVVSVMLVRDSSIKVPARVGDSPARIAEIVGPLFAGADREKFLCVMLDARKKVLGVNVVSVGTLSASLVHPREVFKPAILASAAAVVIAHNHPSGDHSASPEDRDTTRRLVKAGELLGIPVLDHVIWAEDSTGAARWFSFREGGLL